MRPGEMGAGGPRVGMRPVPCRCPAAQEGAGRGAVSRDKVLGSLGGLNLARAEFQSPGVISQQFAGPHPAPLLPWCQFHRPAAGRLRWVLWEGNQRGLQFLAWCIACAGSSVSARVRMSVPEAVIPTGPTRE